MTTETIQEAIDRVKELCDEKMEGYKMVSLRSALRELNYNPDDTQEVIYAVAKAGFSYCLDETVECSSGVGSDTGPEYPNWRVCFWGPDQLKSRLAFIRIA